MTPGQKVLESPWPGGQESLNSEGSRTLTRGPWPSRGLQGPPGASLGGCLEGFSKPRRLFRDLSVGFGVFPSRGKSMYIAIYLADVREEPGRALYVHSP